MYASDRSIAKLSKKTKIRYLNYAYRILIGKVIDTLFVITLEHPPELCFGRKEYIAEGKRWQDSMDERAKSLGMKIHGAYLSTIEHTFYFILEADEVRAISEFFSPPFLTHHRARISPVIDTRTAFNLTFAKEGL